MQYLQSFTKAFLPAAASAGQQLSCQCRYSASLTRAFQSASTQFPVGKTPNAEQCC